MVRIPTRTSLVWCSVPVLYFLYSRCFPVPFPQKACKITLTLRAPCYAFERGYIDYWTRAVPEELDMYRILQIWCPVLPIVISLSSVVDPDPDTYPYLDWIGIRIQWCPWIRIRIRNSDPDQGGQKWPTKKEKKLINFIFWSTGCSLLRAEGFSCSLDVI